MADHNEIRALKTSMAGALDTASALAALQDRVTGVDDHGDIDPALLEDLARVTAAHAVASAALRGLVGTMQTRRATVG